MPLPSELLPGVPIVESPFFRQSLDALGLSECDRRIAIDLHENGLAVFDFPDDEFMARAERVKARLTSHFGVDFSDENAVRESGRMRAQDAWRFDDDVRTIAVNSAILKLLSRIYGRRAFPFQTLNFPVGTEQHLHTDAIHFSSVPERFMCGVWVALEDVTADAGPLSYLPGSHKWPILSNAMIGRSGSRNSTVSAQAPFETVWDALVANADRGPETVLLRKGQAVIWAANLLHGGSPQHDQTRTRWSQVTHYYFEDCIYYTPAFSDEPFGRLALRPVWNVVTDSLQTSVLLGEEAALPIPITGFFARLKRRWRNSEVNAPDDFDARTYYALNPDVALLGVDAADHYVRHGRAEARRYKIS